VKQDPLDAKRGSERLRAALFAYVHLYAVARDIAFAEAKERLL
jgi:hypothetical protein